MKSTILKLLGVVLLIALLVRSSFAPKDIDYHYKECPYCEWTGYKTYFLFGLITEKCRSTIRRANLLMRVTFLYRFQSLFRTTTIKMKIPIRRNRLAKFVA